MKPFFFLFLLLPLLQACDLFAGADEPSPEPEHLSRTVLVYWAGQNSLGWKDFHKKDSAEIMQGARHMKRGERLLLFIDDAQKPRLYEVAKDYGAPKLLRRWTEELNAADSATLRELLVWMRTHYASDDYGLVLASHATGWVPSPKEVAQGITKAEWLLPPTKTLRQQTYGMDVGPEGNMQRDHAALGDNPDEMDIVAMATAIKESGVRPRYILFDCCLMQNIEVLYALRHTTDYIMASPIAISAEGGPYAELIQQGLFSQNIVDLGRTYVEAYQRNFKQTPQAMGIVMSIVRTDKVEAIAEELAKVLPQKQENEKGETRYWNMEKVQKYAYFHRYNFYRPHYYDLNDALRQTLAPEDYAKVKKAIAEAVVYKGTTVKFFQPGSHYLYEPVDATNYCGISMFVPQDIYAKVATSSKLGNLNEAFRHTAWYEAAGWKKAGW